MILMLLTTAMTMRDTWMEVGGGSLFNWLRFSEMCVNREQRRVPEGRKQRAGESCVELLQEGGRGVIGGCGRGVIGCPDPNGAVRAETPEGKVGF